MTIGRDHHKTGVQSSMTVAERINEMRDKLTPTEVKLVNGMMDNYPFSGLGGISDLAQKGDVSTATVIRLSKKLGFKGFPELQATLHAELESMLSTPSERHDNLAEEASGEHMLNIVSAAVLENCQNTFRRMDPAEFDQVAELLANTDRHLHIAAGRISYSMAEHLYTHMQLVRPKVSKMQARIANWPHYLLDMEEGDVLAIFDVRRYEPELMRFAEMAAARGVVIVLFTDHWGSPIGKVARHSFTCRIEIPSRWDSAVVTLILIESLVASVMALRQSETRDRMKDLEDLFQKSGLLRKLTWK